MQILTLLIAAVCIFVAFLIFTKITKIVFIVGVIALIFGLIFYGNVDMEDIIFPSEAQENVTITDNAPVEAAQNATGINETEGLPEPAQ